MKRKITDILIPVLLVLTAARLHAQITPPAVVSSVNGGTGAVTSASSGAYASRPSCTSTVNGYVYYTTDSPYALVCNGSVWVPQANGYIMGDPTSPNSQTWTAFNSASITNTFLARIVTAPAGAAYNKKGETIPVPTRPYHVTLAILSLRSQTSFSNCGGIWTDAGTNWADLTVYSNTGGTDAVAASHAASFTAAPTDYTSNAMNLYTRGAVVYVDMAEDTGTSCGGAACRTVSLCADPNGQYCQQIDQRARTTDITPVNVGWFCDTGTSNTVSTGVLLGVKVH